ncbi:AAA family ATPase, partial [Mesorhizobium sp. LNHC229A00]|uniref:AAA family ATPase n=1 Tax=Mesorhizobium sp. LNHC229A00 TaxID=1287240 RepID=UPI0018DDE978
MKQRLRAYRQTHMEPGERVDFVLLPARIDLFARPGEQDVETSRGTDALIAEIKAWSETFTVPLELVVIDTLATATPGANENASTDMSVVLSNLERIRDECRCTVLMVHHKPRNGNNPRGHSSLFANVDNAIELEITPRLDIAFREDGTQLTRQIHRATIQKNKDGERGHGWDFILKQVVLGKRPNGKLLTSVVCAAPGGQGPEVTDDKRLSDQQNIAMQALINALERHGEDTPDMLKLPKSIKTVVRMGHWRIEYAALSMQDDEDPKKKQERIKKALQRAGERFFGAK